MYESNWYMSKSICSLFRGRRNCYYDVHKWLNVVEVELIVIICVHIYVDEWIFEYMEWSLNKWNEHLYIRNEFFCIVYVLNESVNILNEPLNILNESLIIWTFKTKLYPFYQRDSILNLLVFQNGISWNIPIISWIAFFFLQVVLQTTLTVWKVYRITLRIIFSLLRHS